MSSWRRVVTVDTIRWSRLSTHWHRHRPHTITYQFHTASTSTRRQRVRWATVVDRPTVVSISELRELSRPWPLVMSTAEELRLTVLVASRSPCRQVSHISPVFHRITLLVIVYLLHQHKINTNCTSSQVNPIFCRSLLTALLQFALDPPGPLLYPGTCQYNACCGMRWWSIQKTCPSQRSNCYYKSTALKRSTRQTQICLRTYNQHSNMHQIASFSRKTSKHFLGRATTPSQILQHGGDTPKFLRFKNTPVLNCVRSALLCRRQ